MSAVRVCEMLTGISISLSPSDRARLIEISADRNSPHRHVWRAQIVLLSADGMGTNEIMRVTGTFKTCVWRWQQRFMKGKRRLFDRIDVLSCRGESCRSAEEWRWWKSTRTRSTRRCWPCFS